MSMRYIIRRPKPEDLDQVRGFVSDLDKQLGEPGADLRRELWHVISPMQRVVFDVTARKVGEKYQWVCHTVELVAETEPDFRKLSQQFQVTDLSHLS